MEQQDESLQEAISKSNNGTYLGDFSTVRGIIQEFGQSILDRHQAAVDAGKDRAMVAGDDRSACFELADVFLGRNDQYQVIGDWNTNGSLTNYLRANLTDAIDVKESDRDVVAQAFALIVGAAYEAMESASDDDLQAKGYKMNDKINYLTKLLIGAPV